MKNGFTVRSLEDMARLLHSNKTIRDRSRPFVMVSYAQSVDGSIATADRRPLAISDAPSMVLTHRLRALFDGILVGIETVLADNPQLSVRLVEGKNPRPVILDTHLRTPVACRLLERTDMAAWLVSGPDPPRGRAEPLSLAGAEIMACAVDAEGKIDLHHLMAALHKRGIRSLMVEGGSRVITSFLRAELVDRLVITVSPRLIGGLQVVAARNGREGKGVQLTDFSHERLGRDLVLWARPEWETP